MKKIITDSAVEELENYLRFEEKSENTIQKYIRDVRFLREFASVREISKTLAIEFKAYLAEKYELSSSNSMIGEYIRFYNNERIQIKTKLTPLEKRSQYVV